MNPEIDTIIPTTKWRFDEAVTDAFQDMLKRSIPGYDQMRALCFEVGSRFVAHRTEVVDLGCSRGDALEPFINKFGAYNHYTAIDVSEPMLRACQQRFSGYIESNVMDVKYLDLRKEYPPVNASLTLSIFTLQFTPIEYRSRIIKSIFDHTIDGGALVITEKVLGCTAETDALLTGCYYDHKREAGYTEEQIQRKRMALEGVLVPVQSSTIEDMLYRAGFKGIECFWRNLCFAGWVAIRG